MASTATKRSFSELEVGSSPAKRVRKLRNPTPVVLEDDSDLEIKEEDGSDGSSFDDEDEMSVGVMSQAGTPLSPASSLRPSDQKIHVCPFEDCGKAYPRAFRLREHMRVHTGERPFVCLYDGCDKAFNRTPHLKRHVASAHTGERNFHCEIKDCGKSFISGQRLKNHMQAHAGVEKYRCQDYLPCDLSFRKHNTLQRHIDSVHLGMHGYVCEQESSRTGKSCEQRFKTSAALKAHTLNEHTGPRYWCHDCGEDMPLDTDGMDEVDSTQSIKSGLGFLTYAEYLTHIREVHKPQCPTCHRIFKRNNQLQAHIEAQHGDKPVEERKSHICTEPGCGKGFVKPANLRVHVRSVHAHERKFVCGTFDVSQSRALETWDASEGCGQSFGAKATLEEHIRTQHLGLVGTVKQRKNLQKVRKTQPKMSALGLVTGVGYEEPSESGRHIACPVDGCKHRFMREYDRDVHLELKHGIGARVEWPAFNDDNGEFWVSRGGEVDLLDNDDDDDDDDDDEFHRFLEEKARL